VSKKLKLLKKKARFRMTKLVTCLFLSIIFFGCSTTRISEENAKELMRQYRNNWVFVEQNDSIKVGIKVLFFSDALHVGVIQYPAFCIGVTNKGDTIGAIDQSWPRNHPIKKGANIYLEEPKIALWKEFEYNHFPVFSLERRKSILELHKVVKSVYNCTFVVLD
jgi:hypothetical protein